MDLVEGWLNVIGFAIGSVFGAAAIAWAITWVLWHLGFKNWADRSVTHSTLAAVMSLISVYMQIQKG